MSETVDHPRCIIVTGDLDEKRAAHRTESEEGDEPVIVYFTAVWCAPCYRMNPHIKAALEAHETLHVFSVDVDKNRNACTKYHVNSVPTFHFYRRRRRRSVVYGDHLAEFTRQLPHLYDETEPSDPDLPHSGDSTYWPLSEYVDPSSQPPSVEPEDHGFDPSDILSGKICLLDPDDPAYDQIDVEGAGEAGMVGEADKAGGSVGVTPAKNLEGGAAGPAAASAEIDEADPALDEDESDKED